MSTIYDVVIIGGGPAGLSAGLYAGRAKMKTLLIEQAKLGGQIVTTGDVENYPGAIEHPTGPALVARMATQCDDFGAERIFDTVREIEEEQPYKRVVCAEGSYLTKSIIVATGATPRKIGCPGEKELTGKGVSYCATCDAAFFEDFQVFVIGGGDSAVEEAIFLTKFARKVTIVHRRDALRAAKSIQEKAFKNPKIDFIWNAEVVSISGEGIAEALVLKDRETGETTRYEADPDDGTFGIFVFVGYLPLTDIFKGYLDMNAGGYILTDENMKTQVPGVFAAGDCREKSLRQVVTACSDGAIAAVQAEKYIESHFEED